MIQETEAHDKKGRRGWLLPLAVVALLLLPGLVAAWVGSSRQPDTPPPAAQSKSTPSATSFSVTQEPVTAVPDTPIPASILAPDFTLPDLEGATWTLSQFRGRPVVLFFWATW